MFKKSAKKDVAFHVHLHNIEPWPSSLAVNQPLQVAWARGSSKSGVTRPAQLQGTAYVFEETIVVPCTLQQVHHCACTLLMQVLSCVIM